MNVQHLKSVATELLQAHSRRTDEPEHYRALADTSSVDLARGILALLEKISVETPLDLSPSERLLLVRAFRDHSGGTPCLTQINCGHESDVAQQLREKGLLLFASIPCFVFPTKKGTLHARKIIAEEVAKQEQAQNTAIV